MTDPNQLRSREKFVWKNVMMIQYLHETSHFNLKAEDHHHCIPYFVMICTTENLIL
jgi:hypothetical protein